jgi:hypothetical protein
MNAKNPEVVFEDLKHFATSILKHYTVSGTLKRIMALILGIAIEIV